MKTLKIFLSLICLVLTSLSFSQEVVYKIGNSEQDTIQYIQPCFTNLGNIQPSQIHSNSNCFDDSINVNISNTLTFISGDVRRIFSHNHFDNDVVEKNTFNFNNINSSIFAPENNHIFYNDVITFNNVGNYYLYFINNNNNNERVYIKIVVTEEETVSTDNFEMSNIEINCYPNPTQDYVNVTISEHTNDQIELLDMTGKVIKSVSGSEFNNYVYRFDLTNLPQGMYMIRFRDNIKRIIKQ